ncbi:MAG: hypothetical protein AABY15_06980 [Nanoarchaeota archaeon]
MTKISRSTYMKVVGENRRLLKDIKTLTGPMSPERITTSLKYRKMFEDEKKMMKMIERILIELTKPKEEPGSSC